MVHYNQNAGNNMTQKQKESLRLFPRKTGSCHVNCWELFGLQNLPGLLSLQEWTRQIRVPPGVWKYLLESRLQIFHNFLFSQRFYCLNSSPPHPGFPHWPTLQVMLYLSKKGFFSRIKPLQPISLVTGQEIAEETPVCVKSCTYSHYFMHYGFKNNTASPSQ